MRAFQRRKPESGKGSPISAFRKTTARGTRIKKHSVFPRAPTIPQANDSPHFRGISFEQSGIAAKKSLPDAPFPVRIGNLPRPFAQNAKYAGDRRRCPPRRGADDPLNLPVNGQRRTHGRGIFFRSIASYSAVIPHQHAKIRDRVIWANGRFISKTPSFSADSSKLFKKRFFL